MDLCLDLRDNFELVKNNAVTCWILDMADFVKDCTNPANVDKDKVQGCTDDLAGSVQLEMPFNDEDVFNEYFYKGFLLSEKGSDYVEGQDLGLNESKTRLKYMRISSQSIGLSTASRAEKLPLRDKWDKYVQDFSDNDAPEGLQIVYQEADVFWAWMQSE